MSFSQYYGDIGLARKRKIAYSSYIFSVFDLASEFHPIPMHKSDAQKKAFSTTHEHYQFNRMPFGLKNVPTTFQRLMDQVLSE